MSDFRWHQTFYRMKFCSINIYATIVVSSFILGAWEQHLCTYQPISDENKYDYGVYDSLNILSCIHCIWIESIWVNKSSIFLKINHLVVLRCHCFSKEQKIQNSATDGSVVVEEVVSALQQVLRNAYMIVIWANVQILNTHAWLLQY